MIWGDDVEGPVRRAFPLSVKKIEWALAGGRSPYLKNGQIASYGTSNCRVCKRTLKWGDGTYNFDHKDNNSHRNSQVNCYLVCRNCHGKHTVIKTRKVYDVWGNVDHHQKIKMTVAYKKPKKTIPTTKRQGTTVRRSRR